MELMTKYQYTYFIYPYVIGKEGYQNYIQNLLKNKKCKFRIFEKEKDMHLYQYFLPNIRNQFFWTFNLTKEGLRSFEELDVSLKAKLLSEHDCNMFSYDMQEDLQGKVGEKGGIFFDITKIKLICFKTGICFLLLKTSLINNKSFTDILNFNYKFKEINSTTYSMKDYENICLQPGGFNNVTEISSLIKKLTGSNCNAKEIDLDKEKMLVYSYCCLDQNSWNENTQDEVLNTLFEKYRLFLPANMQMAGNIKDNENTEIYETKFVRYGTSNTGVVLLTSDINTQNYTIIAQKYESEYLYTYILELYKKLLLKKLNYEFNKTSDFKNVRSIFLDFTKKLWIQDVTDDEFGKKLSQSWNKYLNLEETFLKLKNKYDILYKEYNVEQVSKKNGKFAIAIVALIVICVINLLLQLFG